MQLDQAGVFVGHGVKLDGIALGVGEDPDDGVGGAEVVFV